MHVLSQHMFISASDSESWLRDHFTIHLQAKQKKMGASLKHPHERNTRPLATLSYHDLYLKPEILWLSVIYSQNTCMSKTYFLSLKALFVCWWRAPEHSCATELLWNETCTSKLTPLALETLTLCLLLISQAMALSALSITRGNVK